MPGARGGCGWRAAIVTYGEGMVLTRLVRALFGKQADRDRPPTTGDELADEVRDAMGPGYAGGGMGGGVGSASHRHLEDRDRS